jgi:uncharacterized MAPEG superfamily protein
MTVEMHYLALTALLCATLWVPFIVGVSRYDGANFKTNMVTPPDPARLPSWVQRANRAQLNLVEQFAPFAVLVLVAHATGQFDVFTAWATALFFWFRVAHAVTMYAAFNLFPLRSILFTFAWFCIIVLAWRVIF